MSLLSSDTLRALFDKEGPVDRALPHFEVRLQQVEMMLRILEGYQQEQTVLVEAGTGTGKSLAYLIPAVLWAATHKEKTVISTYTIHLQEQLLHKDIPLVKKALGIDCRVALVKGMSNYLCRRRLEEAKMESLLLEEEERRTLEQISHWAETTTEGARSSLPVIPAKGVWEKICAEHDTCTYHRCPYYKECHFFRARARAREAQLLIVNHHILFSDLALRRKKDDLSAEAIIPSYKRLILDEAHHIPHVATEFLAIRLSRLDLLRIVGRIAAEKGKGSQGKLIQLREKLLQCKKEKERIQPILHKLSIEFPAQRQALLDEIIHAFQAINAFLTQALPVQERYEEQETQLRLLPHHCQQGLWQEEVIPRTLPLIDQLHNYAEMVRNLDKEVRSLRDDDLSTATEGIRYELSALAERLCEGARLLKHFIEEALDPSTVRWIERQPRKMMTHITLVDAPLDVAPVLRESLFSPLATIVLCSATLATQKTFSFLRQQLGLTQEHFSEQDVTESLFSSPFNYAEQALFAVPSDLPLPNTSSFTPAVIQAIRKVVQAARGNTLVLFTSYQQMDQAYQALSPHLSLLRQGDSQRHQLLETFKREDGTTLFATSSFWEGIDVVGDALRCVILVKLPFPVPTEPLVEARMEALAAEGASPFWSYSVPQAIVQFKQGFGRLIRNKKDRGCIVCLDPRLVHKSYGQAFVQSLPPCRTLFAPQNTVITQISQFLWQKELLLLS